MIGTAYRIKGRQDSEGSEARAEALGLFESTERFDQYIK
jgi:hypothetical protein